MALRLLGLLAVLILPGDALAAGIDGAELTLLSALPFAGILLSIAILPLVAHQLWEHHQGKIAAFWALLGVIPLILAAGLGGAGQALLATLLHEYLPFILLLTALFTIAGGIVVRGNLHGSPATNTALLAIGAGLASIIGTTGAAMVMIRPLLRANDDRKRSAHTIVFFIFLVANIGGSLTPLGDPPLFLGFLNGVDFFWTTTHLLPQTLVLAAILLALFYGLDRVIYRADGHTPPDPTPDAPVRVTGSANLVLIAVVIAAILLSARLDLGSLDLAGVELKTASALRDLVLVAAAWASIVLTPSADREANGFNWEPIKEVAKLFAAIFVTIIPVLAILAAGKSGSLSGLVAMVARPDGTPSPTAYFWLTGILSSFLDNAPTYLVFFQLAGGDAARLMTTDAPILAAISAGAVFMGAVTYIGNAPNFMVYAIARRAGVKMPGFFGYMAWSCGILLPLLALLTLVFFA